MPRHSTIPTLYDGGIAVSINKLKEWGYLRPNNYQSGTLTWSRNGNTTGSICIIVDTCSDEPYLELDYKYREKPVRYMVHLVSVASNIGEGEVWYFVCPSTGKIAGCSIQWVRCSCTGTPAKATYMKSRHIALRYGASGFLPGHPFSRIVAKVTSHSNGRMRTAF